MAIRVIYNAKMRNTSICGATETILMHKKIVKKFCNPILKNLEEKGCKIYGDKFLKGYYQGKLNSVNEKDFLYRRKPNLEISCLYRSSSCC